MEPQIRCPKCRKLLIIDDLEQGDEIECAWCNEKFIYSQHPPKNISDTGSERPAPNNEQYDFICRTCSHGNPPDSRFCENCGQAILRLCPPCKTELEPGSQFCFNCGDSVVDTNNVLISSDEIDAVSFTKIRDPYSRGAAIGFQERRQCGKCDHLNPPGAKYCEQCGASLYKKCPECNSELNVRTTFCPFCGVDIEVHEKYLDHKKKGHEFLATFQYAQAIMAFEQAIKIEPGDKELITLVRVASKKLEMLSDFCMRAKVAYEREHFEESEKLFREALTLDPKSEEIEMALTSIPHKIQGRDLKYFKVRAKEAYEQEDFGKSEELLKEALKLDPISEEISRLLETLTEKTRDRDFKRFALQWQNLMNEELYVKALQLVNEKIAIYGAEKLGDYADQVKEKQNGESLQLAREAFREKRYKAASIYVNEVLERKQNHPKAIELESKINQARAVTRMRIFKLILILMVVTAVSIMAIVHVGKLRAAKAERATYESAKAQAMPSLYLQKYPAGIYSMEMQMFQDSLENIAYEKVKGSRELDALKDFIVRFPNSKHAQVMKDQVSAIEQRLVDDKDWALAKSYNSIRYYKEYIVKHPSGNHVNQANDGIAKLLSRSQPREKLATLIWSQEQKILWDSLSIIPIDSGSIAKYWIPSFPDIWNLTASECNSLGGHYLQRHSYDTARCCYVMAVNKSPRNAEYVNNLGYNFAISGNHFAAARCYIKALEIQPNRVVAYGNLAYSLIKIGEYSFGVRYYMNYIQLMEVSGAKSKALDFMCELSNNDKDHLIRAAAQESIDRLKLRCGP